ncbi:hypothetical protein KEM55_003547, partial [Ascosphaera atra]
PRRTYELDVAGNGTLCKLREGEGEAEAVRQSTNKNTNEQHDRDDINGNHEDTMNQTERTSPKRESARQAQKRMEAINQFNDQCLSPPSSLSSLLEVVNSELEKGAPPCDPQIRSEHEQYQQQLQHQHLHQQEQQQQTDTDTATFESENENMASAIQDSYDLVYARDIYRMVDEMEVKVAELNAAFRMVKMRLDGWAKKRSPNHPKL